MNTCVARACVVLIGSSCWCSRMGETCLFENNSIFFQRLNAGWLCFWDKNYFLARETTSMTMAEAKMMMAAKMFQLWSERRIRLRRRQRESRAPCGRGGRTGVRVGGDEAGEEE